MPYLSSFKLVLCLLVGLLLLSSCTRKADLVAVEDHDSAKQSKVKVKQQPVPESVLGTAREEERKVKTLRHRNLPRYQALAYTHAEKPDRSEYPGFEENGIKLTREDPVSTFSIDTDTSAYSLVRATLNRGVIPSPEMIRTEELINYFDYDYALPASKEQPFAPSVALINAPWSEDKQLLKIGIKGFDVEPDRQPDSNLVFLLDVSGSMQAQNKLPLLKKSITLLLGSLKPSDTVSIVVYAGASGVVLEPTQVKHRHKILGALSRLSAGGSTAGGAGLELAYQLAQENFNKDAVNRIILGTDGDFNVGASRNQDILALVKQKRQQGVYISVLGFGGNNYQDDMMQTIAQNGNGIAAYIDTLKEAKKVLVDEATSNLFPIANDVKIQVEFNPAVVAEYRLLGYETRKLNREDFNNDKVDAGEVGAGHSVTAIYEITPTNSNGAAIDPLRYQSEKNTFTDNVSGELGFLKIRYKLPGESKSELISAAIENRIVVSQEAQFATAVAGFAELLRGGERVADLSFDTLISIAKKARGDDPYGYRAEFIQMVEMAKVLNEGVATR